MQHLVRSIALLVGVSLLVISCGEQKSPQPVPRPDSAAPPASADSTPSQPLVLKGPGRPVKSYEDLIVTEYARLSTAIPKHVNDSIIAATHSDPKKFEQQMGDYLHARDATVRREIAKRYAISVDSLAALLQKHNMSTEGE